MPPRHPRRPLRPPLGRRPFGPRPGRAARQLNPRLQRELRRANHLLNTGQHANAAEIFIKLGERARDLGIAGPAPMLLMRAAHALLLGALIERSTQQAYAALGLLADAGRWLAVQRESQHYLEALDGGGYSDETAKLRQWLDEKIGAYIPADRKQNPEDTRERFPEKCPYCGASMSLEQVNTRVARAAECHYCGSVVLATQKD